MDSNYFNYDPDAGLDPSDLGIDVSQEDLNRLGYAQSTNVIHPPRQTQQNNDVPEPPSNFDAKEVLGQMSGFFQKYYVWFFWFAIAPTGIITLLAGFNVSRQDVQLNTSLSPQVQQQSIETSVAIVLDKPVQTQQGASRLLMPEEVLDAATKVMQWQEGEALQRKVNELALAMQLGMTDPEHPCYQIGLNDCADRLQIDLDRERQAAIANGNMDQVLLLDQKNRAFDRIRTNNLRIHQYEPDLYLLARAKYLWAINSLRSASPGGQAEALLNLQQQLDRQGNAQGYVEEVPQQ